MYVGIGFLSLRDYTLWIAPAQSPSARPDVSRNSVGIAQDGHQLRGNAALLHHRGYGRRVALNIFSIAGDVRYRQQRDELVDDGPFVLVTPGACRLRCRVRLGDDLRREQPQRQRQQRKVSFHASILN
jgi:hypothetical protein